jgi:hypothetical protein
VLITVPWAEGSLDARETPGSLMKGSDPTLSTSPAGIDNVENFK